MRKPHIYLKHSWGDCGYEYQQWACGVFGVSNVKPVTGLGATPEKAYDDWARMVNAERVGTGG